jgi:hypothetical protein
MVAPSIADDMTAISSECPIQAEFINLTQPFDDDFVTFVCNAEYGKCRSRLLRGVLYGEQDGDGSQPSGVSEYSES